MDGYPRTLAQAVAFDALLRQQCLPLDAVVLLDVDDDEIVRRLSGRWSCPNRAARRRYHRRRNPPKAAGVCDECGTALVQRTTTRRRRSGAGWRVYHQTTRPS